MDSSGPPVFTATTGTLASAAEERDRTRELSKTLHDLHDLKEGVPDAQNAASLMGEAMQQETPTILSLGSFGRAGNF